MPKDKKYEEELLKKYVNNKNEDDVDQNYIKIDEESQSQTNKRESLYQKLKEELKNAKSALQGAFAKNNKIRDLDNEVGGLEENKKETQEEINNSEDVWDEYEAAAGEGNTFNSDHHESFIHSKKKGKGKRGLRGTKLGAMILSRKDIAEQSLSHVEKLKFLKKDQRDNDKGGGISF